MVERIRCFYKGKGKVAKELVNAIDDHSVEVNLTTTTAATAIVNGLNGPMTGKLIVGAYGGSAINNGVTVTDQIINMNQAAVEGNMES